MQKTFNPNISGLYVFPCPPPEVEVLDQNKPLSRGDILFFSKGHILLLFLIPGFYYLDNFADIGTFTTGRARS